MNEFEGGEEKPDRIKYGKEGERRDVEKKSHGGERGRKVSSSCSFLISANLPAPDNLF